MLCIERVKNISGELSHLFSVTEHLILGHLQNMSSLLGLSEKCARYDTGTFGMMPSPTERRLGHMK